MVEELSQTDVEQTRVILPVKPVFFDFTPSPYLRPLDALSED